MSPYVWAITRISLGWIFLWAFLDKAFGPRPVQPQNAWVDGGSPTNGFLSNAPTSPFENIYKDLAGATWADWLFMIGLLLIGVALILGVGSGSPPSPARCSSFSCGLLYCLRRTTRSWMTT
jgi:thiosulfate dehydrogenase (quinone) large subunit